MKNALEAILDRKSVRRYGDLPVGDEQIELLLRAALAAPSGKDRRHCELIVVRDKSLLGVLAESLPYAKMAAEAQLAVVVCGNCDPNKGGVAEYWHIDAAAMVQNLLVAAEALGLGAVWTATYPYVERMDVVADTLGLPDHIRSLALVPIGHPFKEYRTKDKYDTSKIHYNRY